MRINDPKADNAYLPTFLADYNRRFAKAPGHPQDAHRKVLHDAQELDLILCEQHSRKVSRNLAIRFRCREYQLQGVGKGRRLQGAEVTMCAAFDGAVTILYNGKILPARLLSNGEKPTPVEDGKTVRNRLDQIKVAQQARLAYKPVVDHPWNKMTRQAVAVNCFDRTI